MTGRCIGVLLAVLAVSGASGCRSLFKCAEPCDPCEHVIPPEPKPVVTQQDTVRKQAAAAPIPEPADERPALPPLAPPEPDDVRPAQHTEPAPKPMEEAKAAKRAPLVEALQCILDERHQEALKHLQAYDPETQEFYLRVLPTLTIFARKKLHELSQQEVAVLSEQLQSLLAALRPRAELLIDRMAFCEWSKGFGMYKPVDNPSFLTGDQMHIYVELRNFASERRDGFHETRLRSSLEIRDATGDKVVRGPFAVRSEEPHRTRTRLNDYSNSYSLYVPPDLPPGTYQMCLQIVDQTAEPHRVARRAIEFRVTPVPARGTSR